MSMSIHALANALVPIKRHAIHKEEVIEAVRLSDVAILDHQVRPYTS